MAGQFELGSKHVECMKIAKQNISEVSGTTSKEIAQELLNKTYAWLPTESQVYDDYLGLTVALEEIAKLSPGAASILTDQLVAREIFKAYGNNNAASILNANELIGLLCQESGIASLSELRTKAVRDNGQWQITGRKQISSEQLYSDKYLLFSQDEEGLIRLFVVPQNKLTIETIDKNIASSSVQLNCAEVNITVGDDSLAGTINDEFEFVQTVARTLVAANAVGIAHSALIASIGVAKEVKNSAGQAISTSQNMQFALADMFAEIEASRMLTYYSANSIDEDRASIKLASMAKVKASDIAAKSSVDALHILGNAGYIANTDFANVVIKAVETQVKGGTNRNQISQIYQYMLAKK